MKKGRASAAAVLTIIALAVALLVVAIVLMAR
jgi:hypothetical protein